MAGIEWNTVLFFIYEIGQRLHSLSDISKISVSLRETIGNKVFAVVILIALPLVGLWIFFQLLREILGRTEIWRCGLNQLEVCKSDFGKVWRRRNFQISNVQKMDFGVVGYSKYGIVTGLRFEVSGSKIHGLAGLKAPEADRILKEFRRLGMNVVIDVAMPMMVEIEQSKRRLKNN